MSGVFEINDVANGLETKCEHLNELRLIIQSEFNASLMGGTTHF